MSGHRVRVSAIGMLAIAAAAFAWAGPYDVVYQVCARGAGTMDGSYVSRVVLDDVTGHGDLYPLAHLPQYDLIDVAGATPDGKLLYLVNDAWFPTPNNHVLAVLDLATGAVTEIGVVVMSDGSPPRIDQMAVTLGGTILITNFNTSGLYAVNPLNAAASLIGHITNRDTGEMVTILGGDLMVTADGSILVWTNGSNADAPMGLYELELPADGSVVWARHLGIGGAGGRWFTGVAVTANGDGGLVGSGRDNRLYLQSREDGSDLGEYQMWDPFSDTPYTSHNYGDLTNGPVYACTATIGYWKNHSWPTTVSLCAGWYSEPWVVSEAAGLNILAAATNRDFSQLVAQLLAAKLNCNDCIGIPAIDQAEEFLCGDLALVGASADWWYARFPDKATKRAATAFKDALDEFNNSDHCD